MAQACSASGFNSKAWYVEGCYDVLLCRVSVSFQFVWKLDSFDGLRRLAALPIQLWGQMSQLSLGRTAMQGLLQHREKRSTRCRSLCLCYGGGSLLTRVGVWCSDVAVKVLFFDELRWSVFLCGWRRSGELVGLWSE